VPALIGVAVVLVACGETVPGGPIGEDVQVAGPSVQELVETFLNADGAEADAALEALRVNPEATVATVREVIRAVDAAGKTAVVERGLTHGHPIVVSGLPAQLQGVPFTYSLYVPAGYDADPAAPWPLLIDPAHPTDDPAGSAHLSYLAAMADERFIHMTVHVMDVLHNDPPPGWADVGNRQWAWDAIFVVFDAAVADVKRRYHVDSDRVYVTGVSASGASSWFHALFSTDTYAAFAPVSVIPAPWDEALYRGLHDIGIGVVHGGADTITPWSAVQPTVDMLTDWGYDVTFWLFDDGGHGTMFSEHFPTLVEWMLEHRRLVTPAAVHRGIKSLSHPGAYWLHAIRLATAASMDDAGYGTPVIAELTATRAGNTVSVQGDGVCAFEISFDDDMFDLSAPVVVTYDGHTVWSAQATASPTVALETYKRTADLGLLWTGALQITLDAERAAGCDAPPRSLSDTGE